MTEERWGQLHARCWQAEQELDRCRSDVERAMRFHDRVPDGDRRRPEAARRLNHALDRMHAAESAAARAADEFIAYEAEHGSPTLEQQALPFENGI